MEQVKPHVLHVPGELTVRDAPAFACAFHKHLDGGPGTLLVDLEHVDSVDVVGLAVLLQALARAKRQGLKVVVAPSPTLYLALLEARMVEAVPVADTPGGASSTGVAVLGRLPERAGFVAATADFGLRPAGRDDLALFEQWSHEPHLAKMVGSELLYRCSHLGAHDPVFARETLCSPTSLTVLVERTDAAARPLGFMRVFGINMVQGYGCLEVALTSLDALRKGLGVRASRLLVAYAWDVLGLRRIEAKAYEYNRLSINSLKRNGFRQEGILRKAALTEGFHWDILVFSILEHEMREERTREQFPSMSLWPSPEVVP